MEHRYRCQLERFGAPPWTCGLGLAFLASSILTYAIVITVTASPLAWANTWFLPLIWTLAIVALVLLYRGWRATRVPPESPETSSQPLDASSSNNRMERPREP
jgi:hypothetical protein